MNNHAQFSRPARLAATLNDRTEEEAVQLFSEKHVLVRIEEEFASVQQQMVAQKQAIDAQNRTMNQTIYFLQNFTGTMQKINNGVSQSIQSISFSTNGH